MLSHGEKKILAVIDLMPVSDFPKKALEWTKLDEDKTKSIIESLLKKDLVEITDIMHRKTYEHTKKVKREMLDEDLHYKHGSRPLHTYED